MIPSEAHELYRRWLHDLWGGQPEAAKRLVAANFVGHWPDREVRGPAELAATVAQTRSMFTELLFELEVGPLVEGELVAARWTGRGTTPEGSMRFFGNDILRIADGRFVEYWTASSSGS